MRKQSSLNFRKIGNEYQRLKVQLQEGKHLGYYYKDGKLHKKTRPWLPHEKKVREERRDWCFKMLGQMKTLYNTDKINEPAIATVNEHGEFRYLPMSKTGLKPYEITRLRRM